MKLDIYIGILENLFRPLTVVFWHTYPYGITELVIVVSEEERVFVLRFNTECAVVIREQKVNIEDDNFIFRRQALKGYKVAIALQPGHTIKKSDF